MVNFCSLWSREVHYIFENEALSCTRTQDAGTMIIIVKHEPENLTDISTLQIILVGNK